MSGTSTHRCPSPGEQRGKQAGNLFCWFCHQVISTKLRKSECLGEGALSEKGSVLFLPTIPTSTGCFGGPYPSQPKVSSASVPVLFTPISLSKLKKTWNHPTPLFPGTHTKHGINIGFAGYRQETWSSVCLGVLLIAHIPPFHPEVLSLSKLQYWFFRTRAWFRVCFKGLLCRTMY